MDSIKTIIQSLLISMGDLTHPQKKFILTLCSTLLVSCVQQYAKRYPLEHNCSTDFVFSMASYKRRALNYHLLERFIDKLDLDPTLIKSHPNYSNLYDYGAIAA